MRQAPKSASGSYGYSNGNDGSARSQDWVVDQSSGSSYSSGGAARSTPVVVKSGGSGYGSNTVTIQEDNVSGGGYGGSSYGNDGNVRSSVVAKSNNYDGASTYGGNARFTAPKPFVQVVKSVAPTSYDNTDIYGSNFKSSGSAYGTAIKSVGPTAFDDTIRSNIPASFVTTVKSAAPSSYGNGGSYGGSSYDNTVKSGGSGYGGNAKSVKSTGSGSYGNGNSYGSGSSYGNAAKSTGSGSYGNGNSYGSSSYGNGGSYGSSYAAEPTGAPYGIQSTGEYTTYYPEKLDLSQCGPSKLVLTC